MKGLRTEEDCSLVDSLEGNCSEFRSASTLLASLAAPPTDSTDAWHDAAASLLFDSKAIEAAACNRDDMASLNAVKSYPPLLEAVCFLGLSGEGAFS
eukprot:CAMPEP_0169156904 /NCGR_PEP_ID=MMETSP1015-20121227/54292_1 /TAXON_ID=342587 /ORGANISM="Karlodinium micrum, Strain CCMP2283" /LENGTH=96 /DNA_ID=CAMNT_0009227789 /DNA_START=892 /DNA_END=1179 /DNA_ORIENTATION=-